jgi:1-acyl-sn-glycerol-3-phosphate acyltransferase
VGRTIFDTPGISSLIRLISLATLWVLGWKTRGELPEANRFVMIAEPHTSNFDLPLMLAVAFIFRLKLHWIGKQRLFTGFFGPLMLWLGGLPVNRAGGGNEVTRISDHFQGRDKIALAIAPTGTRSKDDEWRTGFYWIAVEAGVPILQSFLDYKAKCSGVGALFQPTGDVDKDIVELRKFYVGMEGKNPRPKSSE